MKEKFSFSQFQKLGKVLMTPVMIMPIAGILVGVGSAFTTKNIVELMPFLGTTYVKLFFNLLKAMGNTVNSYLPIIFAVSVAVGYAKKEKGIAALCSVIGFLAMNNVMNVLLTSLGKLDPAAMTTGQSMVMGIASLDTGVFGGILIGLLVARLHNQYYNIQLPPILGIFSGTKFVPMVTLLGCSALGVVMAFVWPVVQGGLTLMGELIYKTGAAGSVIYGLSERALLPFGLHHFIYTPFFFTNLGGSMTIDGNLVEGALNIYNAMLASPDTMFDINISRFVMNGKVIFAMFGMPGAALAIYQTAKAEKKQQVKALLIAAVIPSLLFVVHAGFAGLAYLLTYIFKVNIPGPSAFGGPFLSTIFNGMMQSGKGSNWIWVFILGAIFFVLYYATFKFMILKFDYKTPGREADEEEVKPLSGKKVSDDILAVIIEGLGGADNILNVDACFTRLRVKVKDKALVMDDKAWKDQTQANGVVRVNDGVQIIYGTKADIYKNNLKNVLGME